MKKKIKAAILGPGNIGTDLMFKIVNRARSIELEMVSGIYGDSEGLKLAAQLGLKTSTGGIEPILRDEEIKIVFDCTSAKAHLKHAPLLMQHGKTAVDLTPAAVGPYLVPAVNMQDNIESVNVNLVTCGGQATVPIVAAVNAACGVEYAEIVATISSRSAGPGTRQNIDEFTQTTADSLVKVGGARRAKAIIILNPAEPPIMMRNTIYCRVTSPDEKAVARSVAQMVEKVKEYVPGYTMKLPPLLDGDKVTVMIEVEGEGLYLPRYAGNLDIITAAALGVGERIAASLLAKETGGSGERRVVQ
ncbi:MAG: acetaldehyde dehydrogenase (acetylating) [Peptococcaceae bacterium]|jgi:acetaldehyde dehydrogenase|nr:acetaldehyde dehydrogenase (acetylating) [Peptococcaceae bacterium]MDH7525072.1 acetaldehyde dehydrogenase (acetylating) [Peptococcaceae bacterium]